MANVRTVVIFDLESVLRARKTLLIEANSHAVKRLKSVLIHIGIWTAFGSTDIVADSTYSDST